VRHENALKVVMLLCAKDAKSCGRAQRAHGDAKQQAGAFDGYADGRVAMV
jgi:hypothetical protein